MQLQVSHPGLPGKDAVERYFREARPQLIPVEGLMEFSALSNSLVTEEMIGRAKHLLSRDDLEALPTVAVLANTREVLCGWDVILAAKNLGIKETAAICIYIEGNLEAWLYGKLNYQLLSATREGREILRNLSIGSGMPGIKPAIVVRSESVQESKDPAEVFHAGGSKGKANGTGPKAESKSRLSATSRSFPAYEIERSGWNPYTRPLELAEKLSPQTEFAVNLLCRLAVAVSREFLGLARHFAEAPSAVSENIIDGMLSERLNVLTDKIDSAKTWTKYAEGSRLTPKNKISELNAALKSVCESLEVDYTPAVYSEKLKSAFIGAGKVLEVFTPRGVNVALSELGKKAIIESLSALKSGTDSLKSSVADILNFRTLTVKRHDRVGS